VNVYFMSEVKLDTGKDRDPRRRKMRDLSPKVTELREGKENSRFEGS